MTISAPIHVENAEASTRYLVLVWATLMALTGVSWWLGTDHGVGPALATAAILIIAFAKVLVVGHSFMEARHAAPILRGLFAAWCVLTCTALIAIAV